ncbi:phage head-tail connector protein [Mammaliicoccus sciuri]|uniref:phage head-tail connector protein n=1 Tax=Mammaliicoccus sciuri TaxID=1296 RepID=UPI000D1F4BEF|nr:phage head-tail connector protein [Mammaliicoccus sciuri]PTJ71217.1 phage head-tail adapter protein [Mammaliicoccus sciuri]
MDDYTEFDYTEFDFLEDVKERIGFTDIIQDKQLYSIIRNVKSELKARIPVRQIPEALRFIVIEISVKRYNRVGAEGMTSESVEGRSSTYEANDFAPYEDILNKLYPRDKIHKGSVQFY